MHTIMNPPSSAGLPWKDFECDYCQSLVMVAGTREVPDTSIRSYLQTQIVSARKDGDYAAVQYLRILRGYWLTSSRYLKAREAEEEREAQEQADFEEECLSRRQGW